MSNQADFYVVYRWRLNQPLEQQFIEAWTEMTRVIKEQRPGVGAVLQQREDGGRAA